ncbi:MAG: Omp28-related outer membrane protein [Flavobacteriales bacterium]|nr:Omp28-related outer membrane protein [Flavobacteriales bacterium]
MKMNRTLQLITLAAITAFTSCDIVEFPVVPSNGTAYREDLYGPAPDFSPATPDQQVKRVMLEDFTGQQCGYCPGAAVVAHDIATNNPGKVNVLAIHSGSLAVSDGIHYFNEFETDEGDIYFGQLAFKTNPIGRVNRAPANDVPLAPGQWVAKVDEELAIPADVALQALASFEEGANHVNIHVFTELLNDYAGQVRMVVLITEGEIEGAQLDYSAVDDPETPENEQILEGYIFEHVLRGSVNGAPGVTVANNEVAGYSELRSYTYTWNSTWNIANSHILAFAYDTETGRVLNSIEIGITQ